MPGETGGERGCFWFEGGKGEIGDDKNIRQMKNINKSVRIVSNGSRKVFCEVVKRANLFRLRNGYCARRRVSEARLTGNARQFAMQTRSCSCKTHWVLHCSPLHFRKLKCDFPARNPATGIENPGSQAGDRPFPTDALARHNKII